MAFTGENPDSAFYQDQLARLNRPDEKSGVTCCCGLSRAGVGGHGVDACERGKRGAR